MKIKRKFLLFLVPALLTGCGGSGEVIKTEEVDKEAYDDFFNAKKLLLERNFQIDINSTYVTAGQSMVSIMSEEFDSGKVRLMHIEDNEPSYNFMDASYNQETDTLSYDWYVRRSNENHEFLGYFIHHEDVVAPDYNEIAYSYFSLIMDIPFESFSLVGDYYEAKDLTRGAHGEVISISSFKVYFSTTFTSKIIMDGTLEEGGDTYEFNTTLKFTNFGNVHVELPNIQ